MASDDPLWVATLRAVFRAEDEITAILIADKIKENGERDLEPDDGDTLDVTQVTQNLSHLSPQDVLILLRRARNQLIRTKLRDFYDVAREMDKCIFILANRSERDAGFELAGYDYSTFGDVVKEVLDGGNPIH